MSSIAAPEFVEVSPRDGLQNEKTILPTEQKIALVNRMVQAGARRIEVASFVNPARVPQMADAEAVVAGLRRHADVTYIGLVLNKRGALRALEAGLQELGAVCCASDTFGQRNQGQDSGGTVNTAIEIIRLAQANGVSGQATIAVSFGCPFENAVSHDRVVEIARSLAAANPREIALADTIGVAAPLEVEQLVGRVVTAVAPIPVRLHFHDTRGTGIANVWSGVKAGAKTVDASVGGLGGCPYAPGAAGNVSSEDVAYLFERAGAPIELDRAQLTHTARWIRELLSKEVSDCTV
ncbi:hydroxymethylglutaryl-CoA lyase [uncultured Hyphomonas sp.]|uniref:hydroxymethylglutaryl-CoA lyase n=1 Tax=uncultured Hyphomonas sp. TaxID=225298 RepID=UPI002AAB148D|nr:hydroxymethylglutaryl-CoA lyase [uncultured Hyphomonas sp.]